MDMAPPGDGATATEGRSCPPCHPPARSRHGPLNAYKVLGVPPDADQLAIQAAYRTLAKQFHPDRNASAIGRRLMLVVNGAYDAVKTPERRAAYDAALRRQRMDGRPMPIEEQRHDPDAPPSGRRRRRRPVTGDARPGPAPAPSAGRQRDEAPRRAHACSSSDGTPGQTIEQVARIDRDWLEWFIRTPLGRPFTREVAAVLG